MKKYQIADFIFGIHMEESLEIPENFKKFLIDIQKTPAYSQMKFQRISRRFFTAAIKDLYSAAWFSLNTR